jgi:hypothetical protein
MADVNQNFTTYAGDNPSPVFTVYLDAANTQVANISSVQQITWQASRVVGGAAAISKNKTGGGIVFDTDGSNGKFKVLIASADTQNLTGFYFFTATITDAAGNVTTVATGQMRVGVQPASTYSGDPSSSANDYVRSLIGDVDMTNPTLTDLELSNLNTQNPSPLFAAAAACRMLAMRYGLKASRKVGDLSINYGDLVKNYIAMADEFEMKAKISGNQPYAGGTSRADEEANNQNSDRIKPPFTSDQFDNPLASNSPAPNNNWPYP